MSRILLSESIENVRKGVRDKNETRKEILSLGWWNSKEKTLLEKIFGKIKKKSDLYQLLFQFLRKKKT